MGSIAFADLKAKVIRMLGDISTGGTSGGEPLGGTTFDADLLRDAVHAALDAITVRMWKSSIFDVDAAAAEEDLPEDLIDIEGVYDKTNGVFLERIVMRVGSAISPRSGNGWMLFPIGTITFANILGTNGATVYYSAYWEKPVDEEDTLEIPDIASTALSLYAASYCLLNAASQAGNIAQFKTKVDSGDPLDNPLEALSNFFMKRFENEIQRLPHSPKGIVL